MVTTEIKSFISRWLPALLMMLAIFLFSNTPSSDLPDYSLLDTLIKKAAHMAGYALLFLCFVRGIGDFKEKKQIGWIFLVIFLYAVSDEFHQSFVVGRHASGVDVLIDLVGSFLAFWVLLKIKSLRQIVFIGL